MIKIKDIPIKDRPREKLIEKGPAALSDKELLAILLGKGTQKHDVLSVARNLIKVIDRCGIEFTIKDILDINGIGIAKATTIVAAFEFVRRRIKPEGIKIKAPTDVLPLINHFSDRKQEHFLCISVNGANEVMNVRVVTIGLVNQSPVHPREIFADVIADRASAVIIAHNHPAGDLTPSKEDIAVTKRIKEASSVLGIKLLDHIIFNQKGYYSFVENGEL